MHIVLLIAGAGLVPTAAVVVAARLGFPRPLVALAIAAVVGTALILAGLLLWPTVRHAAGIATATPADGRCHRVAPGQVPPSPGPAKINAGLPAAGPDDVQHILPTGFKPGPPADGSLDHSTAYPYDNPGFDVFTAAAIAPVMTDLTTADFDDDARSDLGGIPFLRLAIGTLESGLCWDQLDEVALASFAGGAQGFRTVTVGDRMSRYNLTLMCADYGGEVGPNLCAWSGPVATVSGRCSAW